MSDVPMAVLDASAYLTALKGNRDAIEVLRAAAYGRTKLVVPSHFHAEVANALRTAVERGLSRRDDAEVALSASVQMKLAVHGGAELMLDAFPFALECKISVYDAAYAVLAKRLHSVLVTADRGLADVAKSKGIQASFIAAEGSL